MMTGTPSETGKTIRELICRKSPYFTNCCCTAVVRKFWRDILPPEVRTQVAHFDLTTQFEEAMDHADKVYWSIKPSGAQALVARVAAVGLDETLPALQHDVAAYKTKSKQKSKQRQASNSATARRGKARRDPANRDT